MVADLKLGGFRNLEKEKTITFNLCNRRQGLLCKGEVLGVHVST